jgi:hypothetical protein
MKFIGRTPEVMAQSSVCPNLVSPILFFQSFWSFYIDAEEMEFATFFPLPLKKYPRTD